MNAPQAWLYGTEACHLCEQAEALLQPLVQGGKVQLHKVDISNSDELMARYGIRIPVLGAYAAGGDWRELGWPFDQAQVCAFAEQLSLMCHGS